MSIDWNNYEVYDPGYPGRPRDLPRAEAKMVYKRCMDTKADRIEMLRRLLNANGVSLGDNDAQIQIVNDWFVANVEPNPLHPGQLLPDWYSVVHDLALFLGEVIIDRHPHLHWEFFTWGKRNVAYQWHVIMGLTSADPKFRTNINPHQKLESYAYGILAKNGSVPTLGVVEVRGVKIDVDAIVAKHRHPKINPEVFVAWLQAASRRA